MKWALISLRIVMGCKHRRVSASCRISDRESFLTLDAPEEQLNQTQGNDNQYLLSALLEHDSLLTGLRVCMKQLKHQETRSAETTCPQVTRISVFTYYYNKYFIRRGYLQKDYVTFHLQEQGHIASLTPSNDHERTS
jgi:hypothetical protein